MFEFGSAVTLAVPPSRVGRGPLSIARRTPPPLRIVLGARIFGLDYVVTLAYGLVR